MQSCGNRPIADRSAPARESAEALAIEVLTYLAADTASLERFMGLSGLELADLRAAAASPGFLVGVLDFLASDETLLLSFAANARRDPAAIDRARQVLAGSHEII
jgi:hypothetical protein